ncbi:MAG: serine protease [Firmicutes bacterium]|nr:serine protease [Bacillota bacterium]
MADKKMTFGRAMKWIVCSLLIGVLVGGAFGVGFTLSRNINQNEEEGTSYQLSDNGYTGSSEQALLANPLLSDKATEATEIVRDSVVVIITTIREEVSTIFGQSYVEEYSALGSGVIFKEDSEKIYVLTNAHVVEGAEEAFLYYDEETMIPVYLVGESVSNDLAVVYVYKGDLPDDVREIMKVATLGNSDEVRKGDLAIAIGSPYSQEMAHTTTVGIVTGVDIDFEIDGKVLDVIQTDASLNPGNSGGALINERGEVIGINSAGIRDGIVEGMGFAISINTAKEVIDSIFANGSLEKASLGIESSTFIDERSSQMFRVSSGLFVYTMTEGGAAQEAGIKKGDIIIAVNGTALTDEESLETILAGLNPGDVVEVEIVRNRDAKNVVTVDVTLDGVSDAASKLPSQAKE